jgi:hypothetical protein
MQRYTVYLYLENALHVSGGTSTHHQECKQLYLQHVVFVTPLLLPAGIVAGSSNGVTNTRCCRHNCLSSWWWVMVPPKYIEQVPDKINCATLHLVGHLLEYSYQQLYFLIYWIPFWRVKCSLKSLYFYLRLVSQLDWIALYLSRILFIFLYARV